MIRPNTLLSPRYLILISIFSSLIYTGCKVYPSLVSQKPADINRTWSIYKADNAGTAYSALDQLNRANVSGLQVAWTHKFNDAPEGSRGGNMNTGEFEWTITLGNQAESQMPGAPETGASGSAGPLVTKGGLLFIGSTRDRKFRAFDQKTGKIVWEYTLPGIANANPSTYWSKGKQYVAISVAGDATNPAGYMIAFALK